MRPPTPTHPGGQSLGAQPGTTVQLATDCAGERAPAESYPQCCFDRKIRCPEGFYPRAGAPCLLVSVGEISIHLGKGAGDSCQCRQFQGGKTSVEITKCHILLVILIKIAQHILYKKEKKKKERMSTMLYLGVRYLLSWVYRCENREVIDLIKLPLGNGQAGI